MNGNGRGFAQSPKNQTKNISKEAKILVDLGKKPVWWCYHCHKLHKSKYLALFDIKCGINWSLSSRIICGISTNQWEPIRALVFVDINKFRQSKAVNFLNTKNVIFNVIFLHDSGSSGNNGKHFFITISENRTQVCVFEVYARRERLNDAEELQINLVWKWR